MAFQPLQKLLEQFNHHPEITTRLPRLSTQLSPAGVDAFGFDPETLARLGGLFYGLYRYYFRCQSFGIGHIPPKRVILIANHSGVLPFDGAMIAAAVFLEAEPPRLVRAMIERFVPHVPFLAPLLSQCGQVLGTPNNCQALLAAEEAILIFPEGIRGLTKPYSQAYQLQRFGHGFMRLAIKMQAPIVPVAVIGAEEQAPSLAGWGGGTARFLGKVLGLPALPVGLSPFGGLLPWPVRYRIHFGTPLYFTGPAGNHAYLQDQVERVRCQLQALLTYGLKQRPHVFF